MAASPKSILIVEDEKSLSMVLYTRLSHSGFDVTVCYDGEQAMEILKKEPLDLVLLDILLPKKDGFKILQEKKQTKNAATPVIVITNLTEKEDLLKAKNLGARDCFIKSEISMHVVIQSVVALLGKQEEMKVKKEKK